MTYPIRDNEHVLQNERIMRLKIHFRARVHGRFLACAGLYYAQYEAWLEDREHRSQWSSAVADHRKHELFNSCAALALRARHGARQGRCVTMGPMGTLWIGRLIVVLVLV